jgi:membrane protein required for colicin V production
VDWVLIVLVLLFAIRGLFRGAVSQVFVLLGLVAGLWVLSLTSQWVGEHWKGARPTVVFMLLRWIVAAMAASATAAILTWWGERIGRTVRESAAGWIDRSLGFFVGGLVGAACALLLVFGVLRLPDVIGLVPPVSRARLTVPIIAHAQLACARGDRWVPGCHWMGRQLQLAMDRANGRTPAVTHTRRT